VSAHNILLKIRAAARSVRFAHGMESPDPIGHIYREILLKGQLPEDRKELIIQY
jgi:hypothetical protein